ncbi:LpxI family protein [Bryobacter aggregatus]|uniref:LpxI family protein n=1 Tax=Bryobacter aggregatus TaxID=360054 RepID=UPI0004E27776|nr:UDP-2,3-diacylglucosamine diphosphatase LpxI [Bryobacter aggregatus]
MSSRYAIICGNGRFPVLALEAARRQGDEVLAMAIKEEADPVIETLAAKTVWISLGDLSKLIDTLHQDGITQVMMAGQVKHVSIFSAIRPDWRLFKLLGKLATKNTDSLIGVVVDELKSEGIELVASTRLLTSLLATEGLMARRKLTGDEEKNVAYGRTVANTLAGLDIGQSVAIADQACVAVEAMEGTDAMLRRAASLVNGKELTLVKASRRRKHLLFDVPVTGPTTIEVMRECGARVLAVDAGRTLLLDKDALLKAADDARISIIGFAPAEG